jgi:6-phosphogluconate dehydrogenase
MYLLPCACLPQMQSVVGMTQDEMAKTFKEWNIGDLESYLIEITAKILAKRDDLTAKGYVTDYVSRISPFNIT